MTSTMSRPLTDSERATLDQYWRAANYLSVGQIYLMANPLLTEPLRPEHIKPRLLGHWGTTPGLNFLWSHLNRAIVTHGLNMMYVIGPGHGGPAALANTWLDGSYSEVYPSIRRTSPGWASCSASSRSPAGCPATSPRRRRAPSTRAASWAIRCRTRYGAAFDNPDLIVACVVGDGEAETGPLATSWHCRQVPEPGPGRRGPADPAPERLEDRQPDGAGPDPGTPSWTRCCAVTATSRCSWPAHDPRRHAPGAGRRAGRRDRGDPGHPGRAHRSGDRPPAGGRWPRADAGR